MASGSKAKGEVYPEDFADWYRRERRRMLATLTLVTGDPDIAQHAVGHGFARALEQWEQVRGMHSPAGWMYRVALSFAHRCMRRARLEQRLLMRPRPPASVPAADRHHEVWDALRSLPRRELEIVALSYLADLPEVAIAEAMGLDTRTVSAALHSARQQLRKKLPPSETAWERSEEAEYGHAR